LKDLLIKNISAMKKRVLLIEDNVDDIDLTLRAFKKNHFTNEIDVVYDGAEALAYFNKIKSKHIIENTIPALILLDIKLPKIDGIEVLKSLRNDNLTKLIPIVMLTSSSEEVDLKKSYDYGANSYILKPIDFNSFVEVVNCLGLYWLFYNQTPSCEK